MDSDVHFSYRLDSIDSRGANSAASRMVLAVRYSSNLCSIFRDHISALEIVLK